MTKPSIFLHERRPKKDKYDQYDVVEWLFLIVVVICGVMIAWDIVRSPKQAEGAPLVDDVFLCGNLENYDIEGKEGEILAYCSKYAN